MNEFNFPKTLLDNINDQNDRINECVDIVNGYTTDEETRINQEIQRQENELRREEQYNNIENRFERVNSQLDNKANKNDIFSMANMGQDIREAMTGGSVAVVGVDAILTDNIVDNQVSYGKTNFLELDTTINCFDGTFLHGYSLSQGSSSNTNTKIATKEGGVIAIVKVEPNTTYSIKKENSTTSATVANQWMYSTSPKKLTGAGYTGNPRTVVSGLTYKEITTLSDTEYLYIYFTSSNEKCYIQVLKGTGYNTFLTNDYPIYPKNISIYSKNEVNTLVSTTKNDIFEELGNINPTVDYGVVFTKGLCIGDSITKGYRKSGYTDTTKNIPTFLSKLSGWECKNGGEAGFTSIDWFNRWSDTYIKEGYDFYVIKLGQNGGLTDTIETDCTGDSYLDYANTNTGCYCKIIERIKERTPKAKIFLVSVKKDSVGVNNVIKKIANKYDLHFIDLSQYKIDLDDIKFHQSKTGESYDVHFNTLGYIYLADAIYKGILEGIRNRESEYIDF